MRFQLITDYPESICIDLRMIEGDLVDDFGLRWTRITVTLAPILDLAFPLFPSITDPQHLYLGPIASTTLVRREICFV